MQQREVSRNIRSKKESGQQAMYVTAHSFHSIGEMSRFKLIRLAIMSTEHSILSSTYRPLSGLPQHSLPLTASTVLSCLPTPIYHLILPNPKLVVPIAPIHLSFFPIYITP